jgi:predicted phage-related endonuclease
MNMQVIIPVIAVDELANVKAQIAELQVREKALVAALKALGKDRVLGTLHECTVSLSERETVDTKALRADLGEDLVAPYLRTTLVETLRITARKTS